MTSPLKLNRVFYIFPEAVQIKFGPPASLAIHTSEGSGSALDVFISSDAGFTPDDFSRLCEMFFRNKEARAALLNPARSSPSKAGQKIIKRSVLEFYDGTNF